MDEVIVVHTRKIGKDRTIGWKILKAKKLTSSVKMRAHERPLK